MKRSLIVAIFIVCAALIGCGEKSSESAKPAAETVTEDPTPTEAPQTMEIDIDKCFEQMKTEGATEMYDFVQDFYIALTSNGDISITVVVDDATDPKQALEYTHMLIKELNYYAAKQDPSIEPSSSETYGGLYDRYNAIVGVATQSTTNDTEKWLISDAITTPTQFVELQF